MYFVVFLLIGFAMGSLLLKAAKAIVRRRRPLLVSDFPIRRALEGRYPLVVAAWILTNLVGTSAAHVLGGLWAMALASCVINAMTALVLIIWMVRWPTLDRQRLGLTSHQWKRNALLGVQIGLVISVVNLLNLKIASELSLHFTQTKSIEAWLHQSTTLSGLLFHVLVIALLAPVVEELLFRGLAYTFARPLIGPWSATYSVSVLFAVLHGHLPWSFRFWLLLFFAVLWTRCRERTGSLLAPLVAHIFLNLSLVAGGWREGYLLDRISWSALGWLYLALTVWYVLFALAKRFNVRLGYALPVKGSVELPLVGPRREECAGQFVSVKILHCPSCDYRAFVEERPPQRCPACCYLFTHGGCMSTVVEVGGAIILAAVAALALFLGSQYVQETAIYQTLRSSKLSSRGRHGAAERLLVDYMKRHPKAIELYGELSVQYYHQGRYDEAMAAAERLRVERPSTASERHYCNLGALCEVDRGGDLDLALDLATKAMDLTPTFSQDRPSLEDTIGWVHFHRGEYKQAAEYIEGALARMPMTSRLAALELKYHLGCVRLEQDKRDEAQRLLRWVAEGGSDENRFVRMAQKTLREHGLE